MVWYSSQNSCFKVSTLRFKTIYFSLLERNLLAVRLTLLSSDVMTKLCWRSGPVCLCL